MKSSDDIEAGGNARPEDEASERERRLAEAIAEYADRAANEETADIDEFCRARPELEPELREQLKALGAIDRLTDGSPAAATPALAVEPVPLRLSGHRILSRIGSGGMGTVYLAEDERLGRKVAIKTLSPRFRRNEQVRTRFMQEARALARLSHPNIVHIYNLGGDDEEPHFVMEYLEGAALLEATEALSLPQKVELLHKVVLAVHFLHQHGIIHRDLKPANVLVGADLEPKLLDFGLALQVAEGGLRITHAGEVIGTPYYFSPEHVSADATLDARSDVFSLGTILYELLTGALPFRADTLGEQIRRIREQVPKLPRRINAEIPGDLQNVCMKALEKDPANRYASAREMADDLERFLEGEKVLAAPTVYASLMAGKIEQHVRELEGWRKDHILSEPEYDSLRKGYERLVEREDAWIMQVRRLSFSQVSLYLGAWVLVVGAGLVFLFRYLGLRGAAEFAVVAAATVPTGLYGIHCWRQERRRIAVAYLLAFCLLLPTVLLVGMIHTGMLARVDPAKEAWEAFPRNDPDLKPITNAQMWWAILLSLPAYLWLRRFTHSSVFSLIFAVMGVVLAMVTLLRLGLLEYADADPGWFYLRLVPLALIYFAIAFALERRGLDSDSPYFYPFAVIFTIAALSGLAAQDEDIRDALQATFPWTRGELEYLFILNAGIYFLLHLACEQLNTRQMRNVSKVFRFIIPGHVLTSLFLLGLHATERWHGTPENIALRNEARTFEFLLPSVACLFVFASIPKQMKNYLATGLLFLAVGIVRLQQEYFEDRAEWPILLLAAGVLLMLAAARYPALRLGLRRLLRRR